MKMKKLSKGQSLVELIVIMGIFIAFAAGLIFFVFDSFFTGRLSYDLIKANFLAEEGIEAARSIRDHNFLNLVAGSHGLALSGGHWVFQGVEEDVSSQLNNGKRVILIEDIDSSLKRITSTIDWDFTSTRREEVKLISHLTDWQKLSSYCIGTCLSCSGFNNPGACRKQIGCSWERTNRVCIGICASCESFLDERSCNNQAGCQWLQ